MKFLNKIKSFRCPDCGELVRLATCKDQTWEYLRGVYIKLPSKFRVPTCGECGEIFLDGEEFKIVQEALKIEYKKLKKCQKLNK